MEPLTPHITLLHPSILQSVSPLYLIPRLKQLTETELPLKIELSKIAMFDKRVLHIAVNSPDIMRLHASVASLLPPDIRASYEVGRPYTPHVTLLQAKPMQALDQRLVELFTEELKSSLPVSFTATELTRFTWVAPRKYKIEKL